MMLLDRIIQGLKKYWNNRQSFMFLLIVLVIYIFVIMPVANGLAGDLFFIIFYFLLLSAGIPFLNKSRRTSILLLLSITPVVLFLSTFLFKVVWLSACADIFIILYCISLSSIILMRTFSKKYVTRHRVEGAIVVYLLIGFIFAMIFHMIFLINGSSSFKGLITFRRTEFMYYSLSTITTVAFGDITPVNILARSMSNLESLSGQLYIAVLIARLVSTGFSSAKKEPA